MEGVRRTAEFKRRAEELRCEQDRKKEGQQEESRKEEDHPKGDEPAVTENKLRRYGGRSKDATHSLKRHHNPNEARSKDVVDAGRDGLLPLKRPRFDIGVPSAGVPVRISLLFERQR